MHLGVLWFLSLYCLQPLEELALLPAHKVNAVEARLTKGIEAQLKAKGYNILGRHQTLVQAAVFLAEFDLITRDPKGRLTLVEIKNKLLPSRRTKKQLDRYLGYLKKSPFKEAVSRIIVISLSASQEFIAPWKGQGIEFYQFFGERIVEN